MLAGAADGGAQSAATDGEARSGGGFFSVGVHHAGIGDLNRQLGGAGYPEFGRAMLSIGGGGYGLRAGRLMLGGEGYGLITGENAVDGRSVSLQGGYGFFNVGYLTELSPELAVYPMVGLGGGGVSLSIGPRGVPDSFDEVVTDPNRQVRMQRGGLLLSLGAGVEYALGGGDGMTVGVRAGYVIEPYSISWRMDGSVLGAGPNASTSGPFVRVTLGRTR